MRFTRVVAMLLGLATAATVSACGSKAGEHHEATPTTPEPPPPTPDFTPITLLRTPAGLVLQTEAEAPATTPQASPAAPTSAPEVTP